MDTHLPLHRLSASQRGPLLLFLVLSLVVLFLVGLMVVALQINVGIRGYTSGESLWSKGRNDAVYHLGQYLGSGEESAWAGFEEGLSIPLADRRGRLLLEQGDYDRAEVAYWFEQGGNHPDDVAMMIWLLEWFAWQPHFARAIDVWTEADEYILALQDLAGEIREVHERDAMTPLVEQGFRDRLRTLDRSISPLEREFSARIGEAARWVHGVLVIMLIAVAVVLVLLGGYIMRRVTARKFEAEERFRTTFAQAPIGMVQIALDGTWIDANTSMSEILGYPRSQLIGAGEDAFIHASDEGGEAGMATGIGASDTDSVTEERMYRRSDGRAIWINQTITLLRDIHGRPLHYVGVMQDVTESRRLARELSHRARHDSLTGLINRYEFERRLQRMLERTADEGIRCALLYLDLDQFKVVNDSCGHMVGDAMLRQVSTLIGSCLREQDTLARLGGDEFGILLEGCPPETAERIAERIRTHIIGYRFEWGEHAFSLGISIGLVPFVGKGPDSARLLSAADTACYRAKEEGRNRIHVTRVEDAIMHRQQDEMRWLNRLQHALADRRFFLEWQPIVPITHEHGRPARCFEVLLRMRDESGGRILPGAFLPAAERYGQVVEVDQMAIGLLIEWLDESPGRLIEIDRVFVNISGASLSNQTFVDHVRDRITRSVFPPDRLCFEITETMAISNMEAALSFMKQMSSLGCAFALDDFGIGASSFAYLNTLPVEFVKIDGVFVRDMDRDPVHAAIVKCINEVAQSMGKQTIAEFVESDRVRRCLHELGVDHVQGWSTGMPVALGETMPSPRTSAVEPDD